jgi:hypothetical protein
MRIMQRSASRDERGAVALMLAIGVMLMVGLLSAGLVTLVSTSAAARPQLDALRNRQYAADAGIEYAITQVRALPNPGPAFAPCVAASPGYYSPPAVNGIAVRVYCENNLRTAFNNGLAYFQRNVVFSAILASENFTEANVIIRAQINFEQADGNSPVTRTYIQSWSVNR